MKRTPLKPGSFRRLLRNLRKDSEGEPTPIQALRAKMAALNSERRGLPVRPFVSRGEITFTTKGVDVQPKAANRPAKRSAKFYPSSTSGSVLKEKTFRQIVRKGLPHSSSLRAKQRRQYSKEGKAYLLAHPFCKITIAYIGLSEAEVIKADGWYVSKHKGGKRQVQRADQLHHRNKTNGIRLINFDYIMTSCPAAHHWLENHLDLARSLGLLCPINCKPDGTMPDGTKQLTTTELLASRHAQKK